MRTDGRRADRAVRSGPAAPACNPTSPPPGLRAASSALAATLGLITVLMAAPPVASRAVTFRTDDGVTLAGTWYEPSGRQAPAVILVHMLRRSRRDWDALAPTLGSEGIGALAFDLRGHGDSGGSIPAEGQYTIFLQDLLAARRFVATRPDALPGRTGIAGASIGANLAVMDASAASGIVSLALLSPSVDYRGLRIDTAMKKYAGHALLVASDDDPYALRSVHDLAKGNAAGRETLIVNHAGHGTAMLSRAPDLVRALVDWFRRTLL